MRGRERGRLTGWGIVVVAVAVAALAVTGPILRAASVQAQGAPPAEWRTIERTMGLPGVVEPGPVLKFNIPRGDLQVVVQGTPVHPAFALEGFAAFAPADGATMVSGELALTELEVDAVMMALQQGGLEQTALHKHMIWDSPDTMFMHFSGRGDAVRLAETLRAALALTGTDVPPPALGQPPLGLDTAQLDAIIGHKGFADSGIYKFHIPRAEPFMVDGMRVPPTVGAETMIHFQPTGPGQAAVTGDFAMTPLEVNNVIRALRTNGIQVATVHNHMLTEEPHLIFLHFVANNDALRLAQGLRAALDQTNAARDPTAPPPLPLDAAIAR